MHLGSVDEIRAGSGHGLGQRAEQLLGEALWVRNFARTLLRNEDDAQDLAQDVMVEALESKSQVPQSGLRGWLATVARRKAMRRYALHSKEHELHEHLSSTGQPPSNSSDLHLELHVELLHAIGQLSSADRHLIVRRHMEGQSPRALAKELGVTPEVLRKRLSRALTRLRKLLASTERGQQGWHRALLAVAYPAQAYPPVPPNSAPAPASLFPKALLLAMTVKQLMLALVLLLSVGGVIFYAATSQRGSMEAGSKGLVGSEVKLVGPETDMAMATYSPARRGTLVPIQPIEPQPVAQLETAILELVGPAGKPVPSAKVVWMTGSGEVLAGQTDEWGRLALPAGQALRAFVRHEGFCSAAWSFDPLLPGTTRRMTLAGRSIVQATVLVDGGPPGEALGFGFRTYGSFADSLSEATQGNPSLKHSLEGIGLFVPTLRTECSAVGELRFQVDEPCEYLLGWAPAGYVVRSVNGESRGHSSPIQLEPDRHSNVIELMAVPILVGRLLWEDDRSPVQGSIDYIRNDEKGYSIDGSRSTFCTTHGRFSIGLHEIVEPKDTADALGPKQSTDGFKQFLGEKAVTIKLTPGHPDAAKYTYHEFNVQGDTYPIDVGDILVKRLPTIEVRVLGRTGTGWKPLEASLRTSMESGTSGKDGAAHIRCWQTDYLDVLAHGYDFVRIPIASSDLNAPVEVRLEPAPELRIQLPEVLWASNFEVSPRIRLQFTTNPFGSWTANRAEQPEFTIQLHHAITGVFLSGLSAVQKNSVEFFPDSNGLIAIPGLRRGGEFELTLMDMGRAALSNPIPIRFDGALELAPWTDGIPAAFLNVEVRDEGGAPIAVGRWGFHRNSGNSDYMDFEHGSIEYGPLAPGSASISISAKGYVSQSVKDLELIAGLNNLHVILETAKK